MIHRVNFDYDQALLKKKSKLEMPKLNKMFEYIYFLLNQNSENQLYNYEQYDHGYLAYLETKGFVIPKFTDEQNYANWWANISNIDKSRNIESKVITANLALEHNLCPTDVTVIENEQELDKYIDNELNTTFYYRSEFGFSGTGNKVILKGKKYSLRYPGVIAPYLKTLLNFGVSVDLESNTYFIVKNFINEIGTFIGGEVLTLEELAMLLSVEKSVVDTEIREIMRIIESSFGKIKFQFDSLIYQDDNSIKWYKLVEINYRKTMGEVVNALTERFGQGSWHILKNDFEITNHIDLERHLEEEYSRKIIITSPLNHKLMSFFAY